MFVGVLTVSVPSVEVIVFWCMGVMCLKYLLYWLSFLILVSLVQTWMGISNLVYSGLRM